MHAQQQQQRREDRDIHRDKTKKKHCIEPELCYGLGDSELLAGHAALWLRACYAQHVVAQDIHTTGSCCCCWAGDGLTSRKKDITELFLSLNLHRHQQQQIDLRNVLRLPYFSFFHKKKEKKIFFCFFTTGAKNNQRPSLSKESQSLCLTVTYTNCLVVLYPRQYDNQKGKQASG